ncbi:MAG: DUF4430 domain-containing protein [Clostridia bacterium]|nr:DUF4430 domain-containing protein [Clostridia bacterium]
MKKLPKHALALTLLLVLLISALAMSFCKKDPLVIYDSDTTIVIRCGQTDGDTTLMDYMSELRDNGEITFSVSNGMITSINGIDNPADYSSCWMLYTSDSEMANSAWGTVLYNDAEYGSAILGAEELEIKEGCLYIWVFKEMSW